MTAAIAAVAVAGVVVGVLIGRHLALRSAASVAAEPASAGEADGVASVLAEAVDHLDIGVVVASAAGRAVYANAAARVRSGTHAGVIVDEHVDRILAIARSGRAATTTVELHGPPRVVLALAAEPMPGGAAVATIHDVSERARTELMRTDFVANISHELKTPVGALAVLADALIEERDPAVVARIADRMVDEAHRAVRTIDDLLELSRIESGPHDREVVDLTRIVGAAIERGRVADEGRRVRLDAFDGPDALMVRADGRQLLSAIGNLVENAVKYSHDGGDVQVRVRVDDRFVEVMVVDHGIGIPERDLDRVFERFYRVDKARGRSTGGTGLGLAIVRHVATNHGGEVVVSSDEGEGSTFVLRLPASLLVPADPTPPDGDPSVAPGPLPEESTR